MITPERPFGGAIGQAVLDDQSEGEVDDPAGVMAAGGGQVAHVGVEVLATAGAIVLGVDQDDVAGPAGQRIAQVVQGAAGQAIAVAAMAAAGARPPPVVSALAGDLGLGQILDASDPHGGVGPVLAGSWHG